MVEVVVVEITVPVTKPDEDVDVSEVLVDVGKLVSAVDDVEPEVVVVVVVGHKVAIAISADTELIL